jgi:hypothetical protein
VEIGPFPVEFNRKSEEIVAGQGGEPQGAASYRGGGNGMSCKSSAFHHMGKNVDFAHSLLGGRLETEHLCGWTGDKVPVTGMCL